MIHGRDLKIYKDGTAIACSRSCTVEMNAELIEVASSTAQAREYIHCRYTWTMENSGLISTVSDINSRMMLTEGDKVQLTFRITGGDTMIGGDALCTSCKVTGQIGSLLQLSATFIGVNEIEDLDTGDLLYTTETNGSNLLVESYDGRNIRMKSQE